MVADLLSLAFALATAVSNMLIEGVVSIVAPIVLGMMLHVATIDLNGVVYDDELNLRLRLNFYLADILCLRDSAERHTRESRNHNLLHHIVHFRFPFYCFERPIASYDK